MPTGDVAVADDAERYRAGRSCRRRRGGGCRHREPGSTSPAAARVATASPWPTPTTRRPAPRPPRPPRARRRPVPSTTALAQPCVAAPCALDFTLTAERVGGQVGTGTLHITADPFRIVVDAEGLGDPTGGCDRAAQRPAPEPAIFAVFMSQGTDNPVGGLACVLDENFDCTADEIPNPGTAYDRVSILAVDDPAGFPPIAEGFDRMAATNARGPVRPGTAEGGHNVTSARSLASALVAAAPGLRPAAATDDDGGTADAGGDAPTEERRTTQRRSCSAPRATTSTPTWGRSRSTSRRVIHDRRRRSRRHGHQRAALLLPRRPAPDRR